jgi:non-ribosomal peptide synthetase component F
LATEEARRPFELTSKPPVRASLFRLSNEDHVLTATIHHIISDGSSLLVMMTELSVLYSAFSRGEPSPLAPLPLEYSDYCRRQRDHATSDRMERDLVYWRHQLGDAPPILELPTDYTRPTTQRHNGARFSFRLSQTITDGLHNLARRHSVTPFKIVLASLQALLYRYTRQEDILIGTPVTRRVRRELRAMVGYFVNPIVIRSRFDEHLTFAELLARTRSTARAAYAHAEVPFNRVVQALPNLRVPGHSPLFQVLLDFQDARIREQARSSVTLGDLDVTLLDLETGTSQFDLALCVHDRSNHLEFDFRYDVDLFKPDTISRMASHFELLLDAVIRDPVQSISRIPLMTLAGRRLVVEQWNDTSFELPTNEIVPELFERQVDRTPEAVALVDGHRVVIYGELERLSNRAAHQLSDLGIGADELVAVWTETLSTEIVVSLLAILKAGERM